MELLKRVYRVISPKTISQLQDHPAGLYLSYEIERLPHGFLAELPCSPASAYFEDNCTIGAFTYLNSGCKIARTRIGRFCSIGRDVITDPGNHAIDLLSTHPFTTCPNGAAMGMTDNLDYARIGAHNVPKETTRRNSGVKIEHDVWVGDRSIILGGVTIGIGAIIGAGAVVTKNVMPYTIVAGNPARPIKRRFDDATISRLLASEWWEYDFSSLAHTRSYEVMTFLDLLETAKSKGKIEKAKYQTFCVTSGD